MRLHLSQYSKLIEFACGELLFGGVFPKAFLSRKFLSWAIVNVFQGFGNEKSAMPMFIDHSLFTFPGGERGVLQGIFVGGSRRLGSPNANPISD